MSSVTKVEIAGVISDILTTVGHPAAMAPTYEDKLIIMLKKLVIQDVTYQYGECAPSRVLKTTNINHALARHHYQTDDKPTLKGPIIKATPLGCL